MIKIKCKRTLFILIIIIGCLQGKAQQVAIKSNLLYDAATVLNFGVELRFSPQWSMDISGNYAPFTFSDNRKIKHWLIQPEVRYWFCEAFNGHFLALHALGGEYNIGGVDMKVFPTNKNYRYQGYMYGAGLGYGYQFILSKRWNLGLEAGAGIIHAEYDQYNCPTCGNWVGKGYKNYIGLTKAAVSIIYIIK